MTLYFEDESGIDTGLPLEDIFKDVAERTLEAENCPYGCEISLSLVTKDKIRELNREHRGMDKVTDVLSFPLLEFDIPADFSGIDEGDAGLFNPENSELMLGDIVICSERALMQAEEYGHSAYREFAFLIAHSMLHLLGFDHETKEEERIMLEKQESLLSSLGISR